MQQATYHIEPHHDDLVVHVQEQRHPALVFVAQVEPNQAPLPPRC